LTPFQTGIVFKLKGIKDWTPFGQIGAGLLFDVFFGVRTHWLITSTFFVFHKNNITKPSKQYSNHQKRVARFYNDKS